MKFDQENLKNRILSFIIELHECYKNTKFPEDRALYANDIALAIGWISDIEKIGNVDEVVNTILDPETSKSFTDYWKKGEWGDHEAKALMRLKEELRNL